MSRVLVWSVSVFGCVCGWTDEADQADVAAAALLSQWEASGSQRLLQTAAASLSAAE